jgi:acyl transferase domain-containing protein/NADPH:quinone reductase-like Zn-dependent oxidoreductase/NADP-dependent 3-hydroxy acid dehydrogenase YdfG/acyl carrier protein
MRKVAIVATSFRMPGTTSARFWDDLLAGRDLVTEVDPSRFAASAYLHPNKSHPGATYTFAAGSVGDVGGFDAGFFAISPREASLMDPQQRLLLEMSWETFENAGIRPSTLRGSDCGVYIGISTSDYSSRMADDLSAIDASFATGNTASIAANRLSYVYDLRGPSMAIDTACSSSLVAFHQACRSIVSGEITQALAGAVSLHLHPLGFISFSKASMLSRQGRCRVFDASADGYVRSEGGGLFLLKDYDRAVADGNPILAVVVHSAVNTDGRKSGLTVPSSMAQGALLVNAYAQAGIHPSEIDYIEAHGTGTAVGDPIETRALGEALGQHRPKNQPLPIGSIKGNVGHLEAASGVAGLLKAIHCLRHRVIPAHIGMETPNPHIPFDDWNLEVLTANTPLRSNGRLVVGVNSFGFGGANAHVILESDSLGSTTTPALPKGSPLPIVVSARDATALSVAARELANFIEDQPQSALYDIAYQSVHGRERHAHCAVLFGTTPATIAANLHRFADGASGHTTVECGTALGAPMGAAFIYSGNGAQWAGMGSRLLADSTFRAAVREVDRLFSRYADYSLEAELAGKNGDRYELTEVAQPALFAMQVGITAMLRRRGVMPVAVAGHSVGEVAASWASGSLSLAAAVSVIHHRSTLQGTTKGMGRMTAVNVGESRARELLEELSLTDKLSVAGVNSSKGVTIAGPVLHLERLESALAARDIAHKRLDLDYAFHSPAMDGLFAELRRALAHLEPDASEIPFYSTVTGERLTGKSLNAEYWWRNIREPVRFEQAIQGMVNGGINIFVELGPHGVLRRYIQDCLADAGVAGLAITTGTRGDDSPLRIYSSANQALIGGATIDWQRLLPWRGRPVRLPNYPWQRERYWHTVTPASIGLLDRKFEHPLLGYALNQVELTWENEIDTQRHPLLADHVVGDATVFPGTGYVEFALAAAFRWQPTAVIELEDLEIRAPLLLSEETSRTVRCALDPRDGQLSIKSREQLTKEAWTVQAVARVLREPTDTRLQRTLGALPTRKPDFTGRSHALLTAAAGLNYGPSFQAVGHGWVVDASALAIIDLPDSVRAELNQYHLHPALVDCTFQLIIQLLKEDAADYAGLTFVPTRIGRLSYRSGMAKPQYVRARLLSRGPHSVSAEFEIFDETRKPIAVIEEVRFRSVRLQHTAEQFRYFEYRAVPRPLPGFAAVVDDSSIQRLDAALTQSLADDAVQRAHRLYATEIDPLLDALCSRFVIEALRQMPPEGRSAAAETAVYHGHLLELARADGLLDDSGALLDDPDEAPGSARDIWNSLLGDYPDYFQIVHAVGCVGLHLPALLGGHRTPSEAWPSLVSLPTLLRQALGADLRHGIGAAVRAEIAAALHELPEGRRLGVVEISEGAPALASEICRTLDFDRADYRFVSSEPASLEEARRLQEKYPAMGVATLDETIEDGHCQLAILTLDAHSLRDALRALDYARTQLAPGGALLVIGQHPSRWLDFVFGRDPVWWSDRRDGGPLSRQQPVGFWQERVRQAGFSSLRLYEPAGDMAAGPYLLLGRRESASAQLPLPMVPAHHWLLLADAEGYGAQLALRLSERLQEHGDVVSHTVWSGTTALAAVIENSVSEHGALDGIVDLGGLRRMRSDADAVSLLDAQVARCAAAAALTRACESTQTDARCCFVTADAATHLLPTRRIDDDAHRSAVANAALVGLVRTLMNEAAIGHVCLVDLETSAETIDVTAAALARELRCSDTEQEVILTAAGERYAPRLRAATPPGADHQATTVAHSRNTRLGFALPGQLRNLRWESYPRTVPSEDEVEVAVKATGLNFRDVMYALGLLSDEAVENGFAGASLGLEFSGVVQSVGPRASGFAPGDTVVGFAPSSFSDRVITKASALSCVPAGLSFEAAATIPSTFFTSYYALHYLARLQEGEKVLIHGAAGGVGVAAIQVAKWCGAEIYATAGSDEKRDFLRLLGVDHIFDSRNLDFADQILRETNGDGVDVVLNSLAGEAINRNLRVLKPFGRFLELGKRDFYENTRVGLRPFRNNLSYFGIDADQLMSERPDLTQRLFAEVLALFEERILRPLPFRAFDAAEVVDAFRHMQQSRHIGKVVVTYGNGIPDAQIPPPPARRLEVSPQATFLVTGGLSGFGLRTAEWLVDRGARHLVLVSRRGPTGAHAQTALARLERRGVQVLARACDVTDRSALVGLLDEAARELPPLRGIVHAAMVIDDGLIRDLTAAQIRAVLAPKVLGAQYLHELTRAQPLDFFVLYSSATTLFGNPGQGSYVAANSALEALARVRRAQGLPATCVRWGAIDDVGFLARNEKIKDALQSRMGGSALQSAVALDALEAMLLADRSDLGVLDLDWGALSRSLPSAASPKFVELSRSGGDSETQDEGTLDLRRLITLLPEEELLRTVVDLLKVEIGDILRMPPDKIDARLSVQQMGLDSLMGVELVVAVESRFGTRLPVMALSDSPTLEKLAVWIITQLRGEETSTDARHDETRAQIEMVASQHAADVPVAEIERIAASLRADGAGASRRMIQ